MNIGWEWVLFDLRLHDSWFFPVWDSPVAMYPRVGTKMGVCDWDVPIGGHKNENLWLGCTHRWAQKWENIWLGFTNRWAQNGDMWFTSCRDVPRVGSKLGTCDWDVPTGGHKNGDIWITVRLHNSWFFPVWDSLVNRDILVFGILVLGCTQWTHK